MLCYVVLCCVVLCYVMICYVVLIMFPWVRLAQARPGPARNVTFSCDPGPTQIASRTVKHSTASISLRFRDFQKSAQNVTFNATLGNLWALGMLPFPESWQPGMGENARDYLVFEIFL